MRLMCVLALGALSLFGQAKPDFTGTWRMNVAKCDFDKQKPPKAPTILKLIHKDPKLTETILHEAGQRGMGLVEYVTDGTEGSNEVLGNRLKYTAKWAAADLVITTWGRFGENEMRLTDQWHLSWDKKTLTIVRKYEGQGGAQKQKLVFEKGE